MGQGSQLIVNGEKTLPNPFWNTIPGQTNGPIFWCVYAVCMLALLNDIDRVVFVIANLAVVS